MKLIIQNPDPQIVDIEELLERQAKLDAEKKILAAASWKSFWGGLTDENRAMLVTAIRDSGQYEMRKQ